jgi:arylsulfate sulfotransferase
MKMKAVSFVLALLAAIAAVGCGTSDIHITATHSGTLTPASGYVLMSSEGSTPAIATDLNGKIVWKYNFDTHSNSYHPIPIQPLPNGDLIVVSATGSGISPCSSCGADNLILEIDTGGKVIWQLTNAQLQQELTAAGYNITLGQMSHDAIGLPNGHVIVVSSDVRDVPGVGNQIEGSVLIDLDQNHQPVWVWDAFDHLDITRHPYFKLPDWIHGNAVIYSKDDGNLIFSSRAQSWLIKIDYENGAGSGAITWKLGYQGDFTLTNGGPADWFYGQHAPIYLSPNTTGVFELGMFDNGNGRFMNANGAQCGDSGQPACYSTVPIFQIDEANRTATVIWRDKLNFFNSAVGNMQILDNGDVWFDAGRVSDNEAIIREVTMDANPQTVLEMRVNQIVYRAIHVPGSVLGLR